MKNILKISLVTSTLAFVLLFSGCSKKLDLAPNDKNTNDIVFSSETGYRDALGKVYNTMMVPGPQGPNQPGDLPIEIISDGGNSDYLRNVWYVQCLSTDEAGWTYSNNTDPIGIHQLNWTSVNFTVKCIYYRAYYIITLADNFIIEAADDKLASRGIAGADADKVRSYKEEARFIRAFQYALLMDLFGNAPFITDATPIGSTDYPKQIGRTGLFDFVETELKDLETKLVARGTNQYGRVDQGAAQALLARVYLNAEVYTGTARYSEAIDYASRVIGGGYSLIPDYTELMLADNNLNTSEFIWALPFDGLTTQSYGGTTFLIHGPAGVPGTISGCSGTWNCMRITQQFVGLFDNEDVRGQFYTTGQSLIMGTLLGDATQGYSSSKWRNKLRNGDPAPNIDAANTFSSIDFPMFRLPEMYLIYAEAVLRGGTGGDNTTALGYLQQLAVRGRPTDPNAASYPQLTLQYVLDERGRELMWEGFRRTDLIRYGLFTTANYMWAWKGGVASGTSVDPKYNIFPIPADDLTSNPNLVQNPGY